MSKPCSVAQTPAEDQTSNSAVATDSAGPRPATGGSSSSVKMPRIPSATQARPCTSGADAGQSGNARSPAALRGNAASAGSPPTSPSDPHRRELFALYSPLGMKYRTPVKPAIPPPPQKLLPVLTADGQQPDGQACKSPTSSPRTQRGTPTTPQRGHGRHGPCGAPPVVPASVFQSKRGDSTFLPSKSKDPFSPKPPTHGSAMKLQASVETVRLMFAAELKSAQSEDPPNSTKRGGGRDTRHDDRAECRDELSIISHGIEDAPRARSADVGVTFDEEQRSVERRRVEGLKKLANFVPPNYTEPSIREAHKTLRLRRQYDPVTKKPRRRHFNIDVGHDSSPRPTSPHGESANSSMALSRSKAQEAVSDLPTCIAVEDMGNDPVSLAVVDGFIEATPGLKQVRLGQLDEKYAMVLRNIYKAVSRNVSIEQVAGSFPAEAATAFKATLEGNEERRERRLLNIENRKRERMIADMQEQILWERKERKRNVLNCWRQRGILNDATKKFYKDLLQQEHCEWKVLTDEISDSYDSALARQTARELKWFAAVSEIEADMTQRRQHDDDVQSAIRDQLRRDEATERHEITTFLRLVHMKQNEERNHVFAEQFEMRKSLLREEKLSRRPLEGEMHVKVSEFLKILDMHERARQEAIRQAALEEGRGIERAKRVERENIAFFGLEIDRRKMIDAESSRLLDTLKRKYFEAMLNTKNTQRMRELQELHERELLAADTAPPVFHYRMTGGQGQGFNAPGAFVVGNALAASPGGAPQPNEVTPYMMNAVGDLTLLNPNAIFAVKLEGPPKKLTEAQQLTKVESLGGSITVHIQRRPMVPKPNVIPRGSMSVSQRFIHQTDTEYTGNEGVCLYLHDAAVHDANVEVNGFIAHEAGTTLLSHAPQDEGAPVRSGTAPPSARDKDGKKAQQKTQEMLDIEQRLSELMGDDRITGRLTVRNEVLPEDRVVDARKRRKIEKRKAKEEGERIRQGDLPPRPRRQIVSWNGDDIGIIELGYAGGQIEGDKLQSYYANKEINSVRTRDTCESSMSPVDLGLDVSQFSSAEGSVIPNSIEVFHLKLSNGVSRHAISDVLGHLAFFSFANSGLEDTSQQLVRVVTTVSLRFVERSMPKHTQDAVEDPLMEDFPSSSTIGHHSSQPSPTDQRDLGNFHNLVDTVVTTKASSTYLRLQVPFFAASTIEDPLFCLEDVPPVQLISAFAFSFSRASDDSVVRWECADAAAASSPTSVTSLRPAVPAVQPHPTIGGGPSPYTCVKPAIEQLPFVVGNQAIHGLQIVLSVLHPGEDDVFVLSDIHGVQFGGERVLAAPLSASDAVSNAGPPKAVGMSLGGGGGSVGSGYRRRSTLGMARDTTALRAQEVRIKVRELLYENEVVALVEGPMLSMQTFKQQQKAKITPTGKGRYTETRIKFLTNSAATFGAVRNTLHALCFANLARDPSTSKRHVDITIVDRVSRISCISRRIICIVPVDDITEIDANLPPWGYRVYRSQCDTRADLQMYLPTAPFSVAPDMTAVDPDSRFFDGGYLEVEIVGGAKDGDCLFMAEGKPGVIISRPSKWDLHELSSKKTAEAADKAATPQQGTSSWQTLVAGVKSTPQANQFSPKAAAALTEVQMMPSIVLSGESSREMNDHRRSVDALIEGESSGEMNDHRKSVDGLGISGLQSTNLNSWRESSSVKSMLPIVEIEALDRGPEDSDTEYEGTRTTSCVVVEGLALTRMPGTVTRKEIRRERRTTSVCMGEEDEEEDGNEMSTTGRTPGSGKRLANIFSSSPAGQILAKKEAAQGGLAFASTKIRIEFQRMAIDALQQVMRSVCFKACAASERSDHYNGRRTIQFRAVIGNPHTVKFRKFDPFVPIIVNVGIEVSEPLLQNSPQTVTYKEGSGPIPVSLLLAQDGSPGSRFFNRGFFKAEIVKGLSADDRISIRQMDPQQFDFALFLVEVDPALYLKKSAVTAIPNQTGLRHAPSRARVAVAHDQVNDDSQILSPFASTGPSGPSGGCGGRTINSQVLAMQVTHLPPEEAEGNANCTLPAPTFNLTYLRGVVSGKAKQNLWRCCELYNVEKSVIGMMVATTCEIFIGFRESDKIRGRATKQVVRSGAAAGATDANKKRIEAVKKKKNDGFDEAEARKNMISVPLPADASPLFAKDVAVLSKLFAYENKSRNPVETKKVILFSLSDESTVSYMAVEVVLSLVDDLTEIHKPKQQLMAYRHTVGAAFPLFAGTKFYDPDTDIFNGYTMTASTLTSQAGDVLRFATIDDQRAHRELLARDPLAFLRKEPTRRGLGAVGGLGGSTLAAPGGGVVTAGRPKSPSNVSALKGAVSPIKGRVPAMPADDSTSLVAVHSAAQLDATLRNTVSDTLVAAEDDENVPYEFVVVDEGVKTVYWLQRHKGAWNSVPDETVKPDDATLEMSPTATNLCHAVTNPAAAGFVAFSVQGTDAVKRDRVVGVRRAAPKSTADRKPFLALAEQYSAVGTFRPVATLIMSSQTTASAGDEPSPGMRKTKSTMKGSAALKSGGGGGAEDDSGGLSQGIKLKLLSEDSDIDEDTGAMEDIVPHITIQMLEALAQCLLYTTTTPVSKLRTSQRAVMFRLGAPGSEEDSKAKYTFAVSPAHFTFPDFKPCIFRRRTGAAHPFQRFSMGADVMIKSGFMVVELRPETFDPETDVIRLSDIGLNTTLRGNKLMTVFKDIYLGVFAPLDVRHVKLPDGTTDDRPRGFTLMFDSASRATSNILQIFVRSFSYVNLSPKPDDQRRAAVTISDGGLFETSTFEAKIDVDHDEDSLPYEVGPSENTAVHLEKEPATKVFCDLTIQPQQHQMKLRLVPPSYLAIEGSIGDALRVIIPPYKGKPTSGLTVSSGGFAMSPAASPAPLPGLTHPPERSFVLSSLMDKNECSGGGLESSMMLAPPEAAAHMSPFTFDEATGAIMVASRRVATVVGSAPACTAEVSGASAGAAAPPTPPAGRTRTNQVMFINSSIGDPDGKDGTAITPTPSPGLSSGSGGVAPAAPATGRKHTIGGAVRAHQAAASFALDPDLNASLVSLAKEGSHANAPRLSKTGPIVVGGPQLRINFEKFPITHLQALLSHVCFAYDASLAMASSSAMEGSGRARSKSVAGKDGDGAKSVVSRPLSVVLSGNELCGLTPAGQPILQMQTTVDVCSAVRLFYYNGKPPSESATSRTSMSSSLGSSMQFVESVAFGSETEMNSLSAVQAMHEGLTWSIQGMDNELLPYVQVNCWCSRFDVQLVESQGMTLQMRSSAKSINIVSSSGLVVDDSGRPLVLVDFAQGSRSLTLLPLPGSNRIPVDILQRLLRNVLLSDSLLAETNVIMNLTMETTKLTKQTEMVRCSSRKQNLLPATRRGSVTGPAALASMKESSKSEANLKKAGSKSSSSKAAFGKQEASSFGFELED